VTSDSLGATVPGSSLARLGVFDLSPPPEALPDRGFEWAIDEAARLGVQLIGDERQDRDSNPRNLDLGYLRNLRLAAREKGIEIEPSVGSPFDLVGSGGPAARSAIVKSIRAGRELGGPVMHIAYGNETLERSRFAAGGLAEHLLKMVVNLKEAARIADAEGVVLAVENHCDFSGREWAGVLEEVASPSLRCKLDTANGLAIYADPVADAEALIPWAVTTHIKDLKPIEHVPPPNVVPFTLIGCPIGDGIVDVKTIIGRLLEQGPMGHKVPLIVEPGWAEIPPGAHIGPTRNALVATNVSRMRQILKELGDGDRAG
jgi:sugar phosphate isomerase/epimerase